MREILFRGKRVDNGEWVEGDFAHPCNIVFEKIGYDEIFKQDNVEVFYDCPVIPETVGEYTGRTDTNGKKIFEGDILKIKTRKTEKLCKVVFQEMWFIGISKNKETVDFQYFDDVEVIGNIHDNPELLEADNDR